MESADFVTHSVCFMARATITSYTEHGELKRQRIVTKVLTQLRGNSYLSCKLEPSPPGLKWVLDVGLGRLEDIFETVWEAKCL